MYPLNNLKFIRINQDMGVVCNVEDAPDDDEIMIDNDYMED